MTRILAVTNLYPPHAFGGYEDLCAGAVRDWRAAGHDVDVVTSTWRRPDVAVDAPDGEQVERSLPMYWDRHHRLTVPSTWQAARMERQSRRVLADAFDRVRPDVLSVWNAAAMSFSLFDLVVQRDIPVVLVILDRWLDLGAAADAWRAPFLDGEASRSRRLLARVRSLPTTPTTRLGRPVVACFASVWLRDHARGAWRFDDEAIVPHGLDPSRYPASASASPAAPPWDGRLLYVGRLRAEKGVETAIRGVAAVPQARLTILGTGDQSHVDHLHEVVAQLDVADRVTFGGEAGPADLRAAYTDADALVFPSKWEEPFGVVPLEAMACGTPVLGTGTGGSGEFLIDGVTCVRFAPDQPDDLAAAIRRLAADERLRTVIADGGRQVAAWLDRRRTNHELAAWHVHAASGLSGPRPGERAVLPPGFDRP